MSAESTLTAHRDNRLRARLRESKAPAISRAVAILRLLGRSEEPLGLQSIARTLDLVPSTCLYVLRALVSEEFVKFNADTKRYSLEAGVLTIARHWLRKNRFTDLAQQEINRISDQFDVTVLGVNVVGLDHIIVVAISQGSGNLQISAQVGSRFPALISATGRCIAASGHYTEEELKARFNTLRWDQPPSFEEWKAQTEKARKDGFAVDEGHYIAGVTVIAAPVWASRDKPGHALVAIGISSHLTRAGLPQLQQALCDSASKLSRQLAGSMTGEL